MAGYIGPIPVPQATQTRETFTATASQTTFNTAGYQAGYLDVFMNGVKLIDGSDYTATNGSDVVLSSGAAVNDLIEVVAYTAFEVLNQNFTGTTTVADLTVTGDLTVDGTTTTINSTTLNVDDINITVASGAADAAAANGAGLTVDGANATFNYASSGDKWTMNKNLDVIGTISPGGSGYFYLKNDSGNSKSVVRSESQPIVLQTYASSAWQDRLSIANNGVVSIVDSSGNEPTLQFKTATAANYFYIARDSANGHTNFVSEETGSAIRFHTDPDGTGPKLRTEVTRYGDVKFYDDDGSTPSFTFDASDANITLTRNGTFAGTDNTQLNFFHYNDSGNPTGQIIVGGTTNYTGDMVFKVRGGGTSGAGGAGTYEYMRIRGNERELVINNDGSDNNFRVSSLSQSHALFVDAGNNTVGVGTSSVSSTVAANFHGKGILFRNNVNGDNTNWTRLHNTASTDRSNLLIQPSTGSVEITQGGGLTVTNTATYGNVFNEGGVDADFRVESDNNANMFVVDAGSDRVQIGSQIFGAAPTVGSGQFVSFNTNITTVSSGGSVTKNLFTRSPNSEVAATGTVYIAAENSGGSVQVGCIIDFFFSNGTLNTTARETGSSQGTMTFSVQENGDAISVTVAYSGGLGGAIRFNAAGHASIASY